MTFDLICLAVAVAFALWGALRGLLRQIFGILGFIGGILLARLFAAPLAEQFHSQIGFSAAVAAVIFGVAIFFLTELAAKLVGGLLTKMLGTFTGGINRIGGLVVGLAKGLLLVWALASLAALVQPVMKSQEKAVPAFAKLDLEHSQAVAIAKNTSVLGDKAKELRERAEREIKARKAAALAAAAAAAKKQKK